MASELDTIKSYMVGIGFKVNASQLTNVKNKISEMGKLVDSESKAMASSLMKAATATISAFVAVNAAIIKLVANTASADMEYQKFATRMWMNRDAAKQFKVALDAMGESMEDIAWNPELRARFFELENLQAQMKQPGDYEARMRGIRDLAFEFTKLKVVIVYAAQWISYYLTKYLDGPLSKIRQTFKDLSKKIIGDMPVWTKKVAEFFAYVLIAGGHFLKYLKDCWDMLTKIWSSFTPGVKTVMLALGALFAFINMSPLGRIITAISALLLLIDDFYGYKEGKKSALGGLWKELDKPIKDLNDSLKTSMEALGEIIELTLRLFGVYDGSQKDKMLSFWKLLSTAVENVANQIKIIALGIKMVTGLFTLPWDKKGQEEYKKIQEEFFKRLSKAFDFGGNLKEAFGFEDSGNGQPKNSAAPNTGNGKWFTKDESVNTKNFKPQATQVLDIFSNWYFKETGQKLRVTSGAEVSWEHIPGSTHTRGWKFDVATDLFKKDPKLRKKALAVLRALGAVGSDEYAKPSTKASAGHIDVDTRNYNYAQNHGSAGKSNNVYSPTNQITVIVPKTNATPEDIAKATGNEVKRLDSKNKVPYIRTHRSAGGRIQ